MDYSKLGELLDRVARNTEEDRAWAHEQCIEWKTKGAYHILNYARNNVRTEYNRFARGLVVAHQGEVRSLPFVRFFNHGEAEAPAIDFGAADAIEKMDGTLLGVFLEGGEPVWHTKRLISRSEADMALPVTTFSSYHVEDDRETYLMREAGRWVAGLRLTGADEDYCYAFEFVSPASKIVTHYPADNHGLYLLNATSLISLQELSEEALDQVAARLGCRRPRRFRVGSLEEAAALLDRFPEDFEGLVFRCPRTGNRVKYKKLSYLKRHRLLGQTGYKDLIPHWQTGEQPEITAYMPDTKEKFDQIEVAYQDREREVVSAVHSWQALGLSRKDLALTMPKAEDKWKVPFIFRFINTPAGEVAAGFRSAMTQVPVARAAELLQLTG